MICKAPHKCTCQKKLCVDCLYEHEVDIKKHTFPIKKFKEMSLTLDMTQEITKQRMSLKSLLSQTENMLKNIWEDLSNSIQQIYDMIEMEEIQYLKLINGNINPAEMSNTDLEKLVQIVEGQQLINWNNQKNSYLQMLESTKNWWDQEVKTFSETLRKNQRDSVKVQQIQYDDFAYEKKEDLYEILTSLKGLDLQIFYVILEILKKRRFQIYKNFYQVMILENILMQTIKRDRNSLMQLEIQEHNFVEIYCQPSSYRQQIYLMWIKFTKLIG